MFTRGLCNISTFLYWCNIFLASWDYIIISPFKAIQLAQIYKYRLRLQERDKRKRVAREYGLIAAGAPSIPKNLKTLHSKKKNGKTGR